MHDKTRREVLQLTVGLGVVAIGSTGCGRNTGSDGSPAKRDPPRTAQPTRESARQELAAVTAVPDGQAMDVTAAAGEPAYLVRDGDSVRALSATCTHAQCAVAWQANSRRFQCPCHRGVYDQQGAVVSGPPPRPLDELAIVIENGTVYRHS